MADNTDYGASISAEGSIAGANLNGARGVTPDAAMTAIRHGPSVGVDPSLAMQDPEYVRSLSEQEAERASLANPAIKSFASTSPANVAATKTDWPQLSQVSDLASGFHAARQAYDALNDRMNEVGLRKYPATGLLKNLTDPIAETFHGIPRDIGNVFSRPDATGKAKAGGSLVGNALGLVPGIAGFTSVYNATVAQPGAAIFDLLPAPAGQTKAQQHQANVNMFNTALMGVRPGAGGAAAAEGAARGATPPPPEMGGAPHVPPTGGGPTLNPEGFVQDVHGAPASFSDARSAASFIFENLGDHAGEFKPYNNNGVWGIQRTPGSENFAAPSEEPPPVNRTAFVPEDHAAVAEADAQHVAAMQEAIAATKFHADAPGLTEEFLNHTDIQGTNVYVDPRKVQELQAEGHDVLPGHTDEIQAALLAGRDAQIPMSSYLADTAGKPYEEALRDATRFREDGVSTQEAGTLRDREAGLASYTGPELYLPRGANPEDFYNSPLPVDTQGWSNSRVGGNQAESRIRMEQINNAQQAGVETTLPINQLTGIEKGVGKRGLLSPQQGALPTVEKVGGKHYVMDGNHRVVSQYLAGASHVRVKFVDLDKAFGNEFANSHGENGVTFDKEAPTTFETSEYEMPASEGSAKLFMAKPNTTDVGKIQALLPMAEKNGGRYAPGRANSAFAFPNKEMRDEFLAEASGQEAPASAAAPEVNIPKDIPAELHAPIRALAANVDAAVEQVFADLSLSKYIEDPKAVGLTKQQFALYNHMIEEAKADAVDRILQRTYNQIRRERKPEWDEEIQQHIAAAEQELAHEPALQAFSSLVRSKGVLGEPLETLRLSSEDQIALFGKDLGLPQRMFSKNGLTADEVGSLFGYSSGAQMMRELAAVKEDMGEDSFDKYVKGKVKEIASARTREQLGYDISPAGLEAAAYEAAVLPEVEDFLSKDLVALANEVGHPFNVEDVKDAARQDFAKLPTSQASNPKVFERAVKSTGERALRALEKEDFPTAFVERYQQLHNFLQLKASWSFRKEFAKGEKQLHKWGNKKVVPGTDPVIGAILQKTAGDLGYGNKRDPGELERFLDQSKEDGGISTLPEAVVGANDAGYPIDAVDTKPRQAQSVQDFRDMMDMLNGVAKFGREMREIKVGAETWHMTALANAVQENAANIGRRYTPQQLLDVRNNAYKRLVLRIKSILVNNLRPEVPLYWLDGEKQGPLMKAVVNPLMNGKFMETDLIDAWIKAMRESVSDKYLTATDKGIEVPDHMTVNTVHGPAHVIQTEGQFRTALKYLGSATARVKLLEGFGWGPEQEKWLIDRATPEDWAATRAFWDQNEKLFDLADKMYMRVRGYGLVKDEPIDVTTSDGTVIKGGHIHITYNNTLNILRRITESPVEGVMAASLSKPVGNPLDDDHPIRAMPNAFYGLNRTKYVGPVSLDARSLQGGVSAVIHDVAFREALMGAQKALMDPRIREAVLSVLGPEYTTQVAPWLHYIAADRTFFNPATSEAALAIRSLSSNFVFAKVALNLSSTLKHSAIGLTHMAREAGDPVIFAKAASDLMTNAKYWRAYVHEMSGEVRGMQWNIDTNLQDALAKDALTGGKMHDARQAAFYLFALSKSWEGSITWLATFRRQVALHGDVALATEEGNKAVRDTQGAGSSVDVPAFFRKGDDWGGEIARNFLGLLMGFRNTVPNRLWTAQRAMQLAGRKFSQGDAAGGMDNAKKAAGIFTTYVLGAALILAVYEVFVRGSGDAKKSKGDNFLEQFGWGIGEQTVGSYVGLSHVFDLARYGGDDTFANLVKDGEHLSEGKALTERELTDAMKFVGGITGTVPDSAINFGTAGYDAATGQIQSLTSFAQRGLLGRQGNEGGTGTPPRTRPTRAHRAARGGGSK